MKSKPIIIIVIIILILIALGVGAYFIYKKVVNDKCQNISDTTDSYPGRVMAKGADLDYWDKYSCSTIPSYASCQSMSDIFGMSSSGYGSAPDSVKKIWDSNKCATSPDKNSTTPSPSDPMTNFTRYTGYQITDSGTFTIQPYDEKQCAEACLKDNNCIYYDYDKKGNSCELAQGFYEGGSDVISKGTNSTYTYSGVGINGYTISELPDITKDECIASCKKNTNCQAAAYNNRTKKCSLKQGNKNADSTLGFIQKKKPEGQFVKYGGMRLPGYDTGETPPKGSSFNECENFCSNDAACDAFEYQEGDQLCYTKKMTSSPNINTGIRRGDNSYYIKKMHDFPGFNRPNTPLTVTNETGCQSLCNDDPDCSFYAYDTKYNLCYTKNGLKEEGSKGVVGFKAS